MHHTDFEPHEQVQKAMTAPVTEIATFYFDDEPPDGYVVQFQNFLKAASRETKARPIASAVGVTHEEVEQDDVKGNAVVLMVGWESIEAHEAFRDSQTYHEYMPKLMQGVEKVHVHHVALRSV